MDSIRVSEALGSSSILDGTTKVDAGVGFQPMLDTELDKTGSFDPVFILHLKSVLAAGKPRLAGASLRRKLLPGRPIKLGKERKDMPEKINLR